MKSLDIFSRFEKLIYTLSAILIVFVVPWGIAYLVDILFMRQFAWFVRIFIVFIVFVFCVLIAMAFGSIVVNFMEKKLFALIRKMIGKRPLKEIEKEIREELDEQILRENEKSEQRADSTSEGKK